MSSFDFQHLLRKPKHLEIFHLDPAPLKAEVIQAIKQQRCKSRERKETSRDARYDEPSVAQFPAEMGKAAVESAVKVIRGESLPADINVKLALVTKDDLK